MAECLNIEQLNQIKKKLRKYSKAYNDEKVIEYLDVLLGHTFGLDLIKESELINCLQNLENDRKSYSEKASVLIKNWNELSSKTDKKAQHDRKTKKRNSHKQPADVPLEKKQKLSLTDYKSKKPLSSTNTTDMSQEYETATTSQVDDQFDEFDRYTNEITRKIQNDLENNKKKQNSVVKQEVVDEKPVSISSFWTLNDENLEYGDFNASNENDPNHKPTQYEINLEKMKNQQKKPVIETHEKKQMTKSKVKAEAASIVVPQKPNLAIPVDLGAALTHTHSNTNRLVPSQQLTNGKVKTISNPKDDISKYLNSKPSKRLLYTGKRDASSFAVSKLSDLSINVLTETIDDLPQRIYAFNINTLNEYPLPFDLIKPVIEKANAKQLQNIEYYSPYFCEFTDYVWERLCILDFKTSDRDEDETWHEFYMRKSDEREEKFRRACSLVSSAQAARPKIRQIQLAASPYRSKSTSTVSKFSSSSSNHQANKSSIKSSFKTDILPLNNGRKHFNEKINAKVSTQSVVKPKCGALMLKTLKMAKTMRR